MIMGCSTLLMHEPPAERHVCLAQEQLETAEVKNQLQQLQQSELAKEVQRLQVGQHSHINKLRWL